MDSGRVLHKLTARQNLQQPAFYFFLKFRDKRLTNVYKKKKEANEEAVTSTVKGCAAGGIVQIWRDVFKTKQRRRRRATQAFRSRRTSTSRPLILVPFITRQAFSALSGQSKRTVPQPLDLPFSIFISAYITWPEGDTAPVTGGWRNFKQNAGSEMTFIYTHTHTK